MKNSLRVLTGLLVIVILIRFAQIGNTKSAYHSPEEISFFQTHFRPPLDSGEYFSLPQNCRGCHGFDTLGLANVDASGMDVNLYDDWETSMMGMSGIDPLWKAKVSHEILVNPSHANELQTLCTSCHAPLGHYDAFYKGQPHYTLADLANDSLGQSGVSCHSCHGIADSSTLGQLFTGQIPYDTNRMIYGPFPQPMAGPMQLYVGLTPAEGLHLSESKACSPCHTLITETADLSGNATGNFFVEQATYHEFLNSAYPANGQSCQSCHMPEIEDPVKIANGYTAIPGRTPYNLHSFAGANQFMVQLIKDNKSRLGINAPDKNFDSTLAAITRLLKENTLDIETAFDSIGTMADTASFQVKLTNKAGHKFPSGYPARRAVLQFIVLKSNGDTLFKSGLFDNNFEVIPTPNPYNPHYDTINSSQQTQIYEMVMGDINGDKTTVLERGYSHLKDNRIPPLGFTDLHPAYDTCKIYGQALNDPDFNLNAGTQGSGRDIVHYRVPLQGYSGQLKVIARMYYQAVPPGWLSEMRTFSSAEIDTFLNMFDQADRSPFLVGSDSLLVQVATTELNENPDDAPFLVGPSPNRDGILFLRNIPEGANLQLFSSAGKAIPVNIMTNAGRSVMRLPDTAGIYYLVASTGQQKLIRKIIRIP